MKALKVTRWPARQLVMSPVVPILRFDDMRPPVVTFVSVGTDIERSVGHLGEYDTVEEVNVCGVGTGWGPWACGEPVGHPEHSCSTCGEPAVRLCSFAGQFVCGAPICSHGHHSEKRHC